MKKQTKKLYLQQKKRYLKKIIGSNEKPRLSVFRSHKHIYAQLIDDKNGKTLAFSSTLDRVLKLENTANQAAAYSVGEMLGQKAIAKNINLVAFDKGNKPYHGRIRNLAEGAREAGLIF
jgi:large subunit ribosomal protein L18|tara:strand:- start:4089 stop:4445 length:357 start_codon:yes stop_codon:yes gene_type:complete